jgi:hypothetical protein
MALAMARPWKHPKTGIYWLRKRVPDDLRVRLGKREEKFTLKTRNPSEAKCLHAAALAALEQRWADLRAPVRQLDQADFHKVTITTFERCVAASGPPGIVWDTGTGDKLWENALDMGAAVQRHWCHQRANEYARASGLKVDDEDLRTIAKAIGVGAQKATLTLERQAQGDFSPEGFVPVSSGTSAKPVLLSALLGWAAEKQPIPRTIYHWQKVLEQFSTFIGHNDAARMMPEDLLRWKAGLLEAGFRTKTIRDSKIAPVRAILQWGVDMKDRHEPCRPCGHGCAGQNVGAHPGLYRRGGRADFTAGREGAKPGAAVAAIALCLFRRTDF